MQKNLTLYVCAHAATQIATLAICCHGLSSNALAAKVKRPGTVLELQINVAVIDFARVPVETRTRAEREAGRILSTAGIEVAWLDIDSNSPTELPARAIILRLEPTAGPKHAPKAIGVALAPDTGEGFYATIFFDRVSERAADTVLLETGAKLETVMGHAMAHEIGHLLLGTNSHSDSGLMSAVWTISEVRSLAKGQLNFRPEEAIKIRGNVARRNAERAQAEVAKVH
jgi:hypothetical protein